MGEPSHRPSRRFREHPGRYYAYGAATLVVAMLATCSPGVTVLDRVRGEGLLRVAALNGPAGCYDGPEGVVGYECELLAGFARSVGARMDVKFYDSAAAVVDAVQDNVADIGAGGINETAMRRLSVSFGPPLRSVTQQLVYRAGAEAPKSLAELNGRLAVVAASSAAETLRAARSGADPQLHWDETADYGADDLLQQVADGALDYTIANSDVVAISLQYYPKLRVAFDVTEPQALAWALPRTGSSSLRQAIEIWLDSQSPDEIARLEDRYFGHIDVLDYADIGRFSSDVQARLPRYRHLFESAARKHAMDWRVIAAVGYQESHWDSSAISRTRVRGIMMLTTETAQRMGVADREDPAQSILGGTRYLAELRAALPESIQEPDRTWIALAAYNLGLGHVLDARELVQQRGGNPDHWLDLRDTLPLLSRPVWYARTRHGYARGREAVDFVANVRSYIDILSWMSDNAAPPAASAAATPPPHS